MEDTIALIPSEKYDRGGEGRNQRRGRVSFLDVEMEEAQVEKYVMVNHL